MPAKTRGSRTQIWLEGQGDWCWPGRGVRARAGAGGAGVAELQPPAWVPALPLPLPLEPVDAGALADLQGGRRALPRRLGSSVALTGLAVACIALGLDERTSLERLLTAGAGAPAVTLAEIAHAPAGPGGGPLPPRLSRVSSDAAGSTIDASTFGSHALHGEGSFLVYLPPGFAATNRRYPVIYLLHGTDQTDSSFLHIGVQSTLDRLIARREIPPTIAVMIQGGPGTNNWLNDGERGYESYVLEVQQLIDRALPTIAARDGRAIAGYSMGGFGAMHLALAHPRTFGVAESWLGFFNGLDGLVRADRPELHHLGLRAFVYGGESDVIADPAEDAPFAARLRAAGVDAHGAVYPGEHSFATLEAHLRSMLAFAGGALAAAAGPAASPAAGRAAARASGRGGSGTGEGETRERTTGEGSL
jgi:enterochelin esterase-like enzyme